MNLRRLTGCEEYGEIFELVRDRKEAYLSAGALSDFIKSVIEKRLRPEELQQIADRLECESVIYEESHSGLIAEILFQISSPEVNGELDDDCCAMFIGCLVSS